MSKESTPNRAISSSLVPNNLIFPEKESLSSYNFSYSSEQNLLYLYNSGKNTHIEYIFGEDGSVQFSRKTSPEALVIEKRIATPFEIKRFEHRINHHSITHRMGIIDHNGSYDIATFSYDILSGKLDQIGISVPNSFLPWDENVEVDDVSRYPIAIYPAFDGNEGLYGVEYKLGEEFKNLSKDTNFDDRFNLAFEYKSIQYKITSEIYVEATLAVGIDNLFTNEGILVNSKNYVNPHRLIAKANRPEPSANIDVRNVPAWSGVSLNFLPGLDIDRPGRLITAGDSVLLHLPQKPIYERPAPKTPWDDVLVSQTPFPLPVDKLIAISFEKNKPNHSAEKKNDTQTND